MNHSLTLTLLVPVLGVTLPACTEYAPSALGVYAYPKARDAAACESKSGVAGATDGERTAKGVQFNVRTPANYDSTYAHPLLVVFAPAGNSAAASEHLTGLTTMATTAGYVVVYPTHVRNSIPVIEDFSTISSLVANNWCIDESRIYLTGHSDGGTVALAIALLDRTRHIPAAIAPSAAGFTRKDLAEFNCPAPLPVMIMHSAKDELFPGFGTEAAAWWAACNQCDSTPQKAGDNGCVIFPNCAGGVTTQYCEGTEPHENWPALTQPIIDFFAATQIQRPGAEISKGR
jgi:polyhydroxybutyrate depolymerase